MEVEGGRGAIRLLYAGVEHEAVVFEEENLGR